ncbi:MAG: GNAT family N-acetyltransferase [Lachnospiraceae bacterium]|nr:GNAT family N-acetyltransferase [Lachnospiraceae bacterium]
MINQPNVEVRETKEENLEQIQALWNDGDVMKFVGFPDGLKETREGMEKWYSSIKKSRPRCNHYSVFADGIGYCGETFYCIDEEHENHASLDIKLFSKARGKGIAVAALSYAIEQAFLNGAKAVWVDPNPANEKALALYNRLGFIRKEMPDYLKEEDMDFCPVYMELAKEQWKTIIKEKKKS